MPRKVDTTIEIHAPADAIWQALTDPEELTRWFCLNARVKPGQGGSIFYSWGPPYEGENRIDVWEPDRRLRLVIGRRPVAARRRVGPAHVEEELGEVRVGGVAGDAIEPHQCHLGDLMAGPRRGLAGPNVRTSTSAALIATSRNVRLPVAW